ncbi:hypothetical protein FA13DRAFT_1493918 [Coprinellus micaceus]|uniref:Uncharacterized protein n=1 Tax=Coprinellus micaceus TaxID=71717 RepID=A0A4Y7TKD6_COPMI|nr:hypothetical protein FA13DRAFT_1493918 [Coprinellus micaceus]
MQTKERRSRPIPLEDPLPSGYHWARNRDDLGFNVYSKCGILINQYTFPQTYSTRGWIVTRTPKHRILGERVKGITREGTLLRTPPATLHPGVTSNVNRRQGPGLGLNLHGLFFGILREVDWVSGIDLARWITLYVFGWYLALDCLRSRASRTTRRTPNHSQTPPRRRNLITHHILCQYGQACPRSIKAMKLA